MGWIQLVAPKSSSSVSNEYDIAHVSDGLLPRPIHVRALESEGLNLPGKLQSYIWI
jgi:hypothetical protein